MSDLPDQRLLEFAVRHHRSGNLAAAEPLYRQILAKDPNHLDALRLAARLAHQSNRPDEAIDLLRRVAALAPADADAYINLGMLLVIRGQFDAAVSTLRHGLSLRPDSPEALSNLGAALRQAGNHAEAVQVLRRALALRPTHADAMINLGAALTSLEHFDDAARVLRDATQLRPDDALAHYNLGVALKSKLEYDAAAEALRRAIQLRPNYVDAIANLGEVLHRTAHYADAINAYQTALALSPADPFARWNLGLLLLLRGNYAAAWPLYESRWQLTGLVRPRQLPQPLWDGQPLNGGRILLHWEQGLGDTLQFVRYAPLVAQRGGRVLLLCQPELRRLLTNQPSIDQTLTDTDPLPPFDVHCPLLSLPGIFQTTLDTIPATVPYLHPDPDLKRQWESHISVHPARLKIGLNWAGSRLPLANRKRTVGLAAMAPLAQIPGACFFSLQKGDAAREAETPPPGMTLINTSPHLNDFADTAAFMSALDCVITCDTSVAHAAGALGIRTLVLLPTDPDWRWHLDRPDSPWYPTLRLYRQPIPGDYQTPIHRIVHDLMRQT